MTTLSIQSQTEALLQQQLQEWPMARGNFEALAGVQTKTFTESNFEIKLQFNPARIVSSSAKIDAASLRERKCFLCAANRPKEQLSVGFGSKYEILVNPFPIFPRHLTIPKLAHEPQLIDGHIPDMLQLARELEGYTLFYNGPKCGASAPDHFHFQAGNTGFMPTDEQWRQTALEHGQMLCRREYGEAWAIKDGFRNFWVIESEDAQHLAAAFDELYKIMPTPEGETEPPMNLHALYQNSRWRLVIFPRGAHRPWQYFDEGPEHIMLSPASVDFGGVLITPLQKDFDKITLDDIRSILQQTSLDTETFDTLTPLWQAALRCL